jgi:hypothetical protein
MALKNPRLKFTISPPAPGKPFDRIGQVSGYISSREKLEKLLLHPWPEGSKISNLRAVDAAGKDIAEQPEELIEQVAKPAPTAPAISKPVTP